MQSRGLEIVVGMFICLGIAAVFILTMRVSNLADVRSGESYQISAQFSNIGGLRAGAAVSLAGVRIGRIASITIDQDTYEANVAMNIDSQYKIPEDSDASILTAGLLGEQYIGLTPGAADEFLEQGDTITLTQSAVILEKLIGQVLFALTSGKDDESSSGGGGDGMGDFGSDDSLALPEPSKSESKSAPDQTTMEGLNDDGNEGSATVKP